MRGYYSAFAVAVVVLGLLSCNQSLLDPDVQYVCEADDDCVAGYACMAMGFSDGKKICVEVATLNDVTPDTSDDPDTSDHPDTSLDTGGTDTRDTAENCCEAGGSCPTGQYCAPDMCICLPNCENVGDICDPLEDTGTDAMHCALLVESEENGLCLPACENADECSTDEGEECLGLLGRSERVCLKPNCAEPGCVWGSEFCGVGPLLEELRTEVCVPSMCTSVLANDCGEGFKCMPRSGGGHACTTIGTLEPGLSCELDSDCSEKAVCSLGSCTEMECEPFVEEHGCPPESWCQPNAVDGRLGACVGWAKEGTARPGEFCNSDIDGEIECAAGSICHFQTCMEPCALGSSGSEPFAGCSSTATQCLPQKVFPAGETVPGTLSYGGCVTPCTFSHTSKPDDSCAVHQFCTPHEIVTQDVPDFCLAFSTKVEIFPLAPFDTCSSAGYSQNMFCDVNAICTLPPRTGLIPLCYHICTLSGSPLDRNPHPDCPKGTCNSGALPGKEVGLCENILF